MCNTPVQENYFQNNFWLTQTPGILEIFTREEFCSLKFFLHSNNNKKQCRKGSVGYQPLYKVRTLLDITKNTNMECYKPGEALFVDETMAKFKERLSFKQYMLKNLY